MGIWRAADVNVYSAAPSAAYKNLDLSGAMPARGAGEKAVALLACTWDSGNNARCGFRPNGSARTYGHLDSSTHGCTYVQTSTGLYRVVLVPTDTDGVIQHVQSVAFGVFDIILLGYWVPDVQAGAVLEADYAMTGAWQDYDISAELGAPTRGLALLEYRYISGTAGRFASKTKGDPRTTEYTATASQGGTHRGIVAASGVNGLISAIPTDTLGVYQHIDTGPAHLGFDFLCGETERYRHVDQVVYNAVPTENVWTDLDLSAHISGEALAFLICEWGGVGAQTFRVATRSKGDARSYQYDTAPLYAYGPNCQEINPANGLAGALAAKVNSDGECQFYATSVGALTTSLKITLLGYIESVSAPVISDEAPTGSTTDGYVNVSFRTSDSDGDVQQNTIDLTLVGPGPTTHLAVVNGVFQAGFGGTIAANAFGGYDVTLTTHPLLLVGTWTATAYCEDSGGRSDTSVWTFEIARFLGLATGGNPRGLSCVYPLSGGLRAAGFLWREEFVSAALTLLNGGVLIASPTFLVRPDGGIVLDGATQYVSYDGRPGPVAAFGCPEQLWSIRFTPDFRSDDGLEHVFFDADQAGVTNNRLRKLGTDALEISVGGTVVGTIAWADYSPDWNEEAENVITVSTTSGSTTIWLNDVVVGVSPDTYDYRGADGLWVGVNNGGGSGHYPGVIHSLRFGRKTLTILDLPLVEG